MGITRWTAIPIALAGIVAGYLATCVVIYASLTRVPGRCRPDWEANGPTSFTVTGVDLDTTPYRMPEPDDVRFPSRDGRAEIAGWWIPAEQAGASAVVVVHGLTACRHDHSVLLPAGMLHRHGFSVLLIDLRDHGESSRVDGRHAGGTDEFWDVLGAWDWLRDVQGLPAEQIGLLGVSLGAATVLIAMGEEPAVAATWADSSYADIREAIRAELYRTGYPNVLEWGGVAIAVALTGDGLFARSPLEAVGHLDGRSLAIVHGDADDRLSVKYAFDLASEVAAHGGRVDPWIVEGAGHTEAMALHPDEYERRLAEFFGAAIGPTSADPAAPARPRT